MVGVRLLSVRPTPAVTVGYSDRISVRYGVKKDDPSVVIIWLMKGHTKDKGHPFLFPLFAVFSVEIHTFPFFFRESLVPKWPTRRRPLCIDGMRQKIVLFSSLDQCWSRG